VPAAWMPRIRPQAEPKSMVIARAASRLPGSTVLAPSRRIVQARAPTLRRTTWPGLAGCA